MDHIAKVDALKCMPGKHIRIMQHVCGIEATDGLSGICIGGCSTCVLISGYVSLQCPCLTTKQVNSQTCKPVLRITYRAVHVRICGTVRDVCACYLLSHIKLRVVITSFKIYFLLIMLVEPFDARQVN